MIFRTRISRIFYSFVVFILRGKMRSPVACNEEESVLICAICGTLDRINSSFERRQVQSDTAMRNYSIGPIPPIWRRPSASYSKAVPSRIIWRRPLWSANLRAQRFRAPSRAVTSPLPEEEGLGEKVELSLQERRRGRKIPSLTVRKVSVPCKGNRRGRKDY